MRSLLGSLLLAPLLASLLAPVAAADHPVCEGGERTSIAIVELETWTGGCVGATVGMNGLIVCDATLQGETVEAAGVQAQIVALHDDEANGRDCVTGLGVVP